MAILAGVITAEKLGIKRPLILSDCRSAVTPLDRLLGLGKGRGLLLKAKRLLQLAKSPRSYVTLYDSFRRTGGIIAWRPREENREADLASNIASRVGVMGIRLARGKDQGISLNDVLSKVAPPKYLQKAGVVPTEVTARRERHYGGTRTVHFSGSRSLSPQGFKKEASSLLTMLCQEVA